MSPFDGRGECPFVMTTEEEVRQAQVDYQKCQNGFEKAAGWNSFVAYEDEDPSTLLPQ